jgi:CP family cyanate transporter-like MFS transporter
VLLALNLRTVIASLPPLLGTVREDLGLSAGVAGLLTTLPVICFGVLSLVTPRVAHRVSLERLLVGCAALTAVAAALRGAGTTAALFAGSVLGGVAVAIAQSALPTLIRTAHPQRVGVLTGAYSMAIPTGATLAAALSVPLAHALGSWPAALAVWALPALVAAVVWLPAALRPGTHLHGDDPSPVWNVPLAWGVSLYFGLQSLAFYGCLAWLPTILVADGATERHAGDLLALDSLVSAAPAFLVPLLAARRPAQRSLLAWIVAVPAAGLLGLLLAPDAALVWVVLIGLGQGGALGLALVLPVLRASGARLVAALTAMSLCVGYTVAAAGPSVLGGVHDAAGSWTPAVVVLIVVTVAQLAPGLPATRPLTLGRSADPAAPPRPRTSG